VPLVEQTRRQKATGTDKTSKGKFKTQVTILWMIIQYSSSKTGTTQDEKNGQIKTPKTCTHNNNAVLNQFQGSKI
jgi:hypothetical protein